jgi:hypothetical protein
MTFFLFHASSVASVVYCFVPFPVQALGLSRFFKKILPGACAGVGIFLKTACGLTFTARQEAVNTFAQEQ